MNEANEMQEQAQETKAVAANFDNTVDKVATKFNFRKIVTKDEVTGLEVETKRPSVELELPLLSVEGIVKEFEAGGKRLELIVEAIREVQIQRAREIVSEREDINAENFPYDQLNWEVIANLPKAERRGGGIAKEQWEEFGKDYIAVMPGATGKSLEQVTNASKILLNKFQQIKTNKVVLQLLKDQLAIYAANAPKAEEFSDCISFLADKADTFLKMDDAALLANL
jgi:hypothetical protein